MTPVMTLGRGNAYGIVVELLHAGSFARMGRLSSPRRSIQGREVLSGALAFFKSVLLFNFDE